MQPAGRARICESNGVAARDVGELTGFPALFDGRVKTLHPKIFGAILADCDEPGARSRGRAARHRADLDGRRQPLSVRSDGRAEGATLEEAIEQIDIGGVALIRAAAKNYASVTVAGRPVAV